MFKTTTPKLSELEQKWFIVDAKDKILGRMATKIANKLRGKDKPSFTPHLDCGDYVIVINAADVKLTGNKWDQKMYRRHSGYPSGFKEKTAAKQREDAPEEMIRQAVAGMLPKNKLRKHFMTKLKIFAGNEHRHEGQQPTILEV